MIQTLSTVGRHTITRQHNTIRMQVHLIQHRKNKYLESKNEVVNIIKTILDKWGINYNPTIHPSDMPNEAFLSIRPYTLIIKNQKITKYPDGGICDSMVSWVFMVMSLFPKNKQIGKILNEQQISFETFRNQCVKELKNTSKTLTYIIWYYKLVAEKCDKRRAFAESEMGQDIAREISANIQTCKKYKEFYDLMNNESKFSTYMKDKINMELGKFQYDDGIPQWIKKRARWNCDKWFGFR